MKKKICYLICLILISIPLVHYSKDFFSDNPYHSIKSQLSSQNMILIDLDNNQVLFEKNSTKKISIASLTKIMTALCIIEQTEDLTGNVILADDDLTRLRQQDLTLSGFYGGEAITIEDLLYGMILSSGADMAEAGAKHVAGSLESFVMLMNEKANELGLKNTHFTNVVGLDEKNHYSTVSDIKIILEHALENKLFYKIFTTQQYQSSATAFHPNGLFIQSTLLRSEESLDFEEGKIIGGKTGYTKKAGLCLASLAQIKDSRYLFINCHAKGAPMTKQYNLIEAKKIYGQIDITNH